MGTIHGDDQSSVESSMGNWDSNDYEGSFQCLDEISLSSRNASLDSRFCPLSTSGSATSLFSSDSSIESALHGGDDGSVPVNRNFLTLHGSTNTSNQPQEESILDSEVTDMIVNVKDTSSSAEFRLRRDTNSSGSLNSIKEHLSFRSIHEHSDYGSLVSSDEESERVGDGKPVSWNRNKLSVHRNSSHEGRGSRESLSDAESSVDDSVINRILRKTDSKEHMRGDKRAAQTSKHSATAKKNASAGRTGDAKHITNDALLNRFLASPKQRKTASLTARLGHDERRNAFFGSSQTIEGKDLRLDTIMSKCDSLNHVSKEGKRIVKTRQDLRHETKKSSNSRRGYVTEPKDTLMERFLSNKARQGLEKRHLPNEARYGRMLISTDSLVRVEGNGRRAVGTRRV